MKKQSSKRQRKLQQDIRLFINKKVTDINGRVEPTDCGTAEPAGKENADRLQREENSECRTAETVGNGQAESTECGAAEPQGKENVDNVQRDEHTDHISKYEGGTAEPNECG